MEEKAQASDALLTKARKRRKKEKATRAEHGKKLTSALSAGRNVSGTWWRGWSSYPSCVPVFEFFFFGATERVAY